MKKFGSFIRSFLCGVTCVSLLTAPVYADVFAQKLSFDTVVHDNGEYDEDKNLLPNSSFEYGVMPDGSEGYSNLAQCWQVWDGKASGQSSARIVSDAHTGSYAVELNKNTYFCPDFRYNGKTDINQSVMYNVINDLYNNYGTLNGKLIATFYAKADAAANINYNFRIANANIEIDGKVSTKTLEKLTYVKINPSDDYQKYSVTIDLSGNLKDFSFWEGNKSYKISDILSDGVEFDKLNFNVAALYLTSTAPIKIDDYTLEFKPQVYNALGMQNYAGQTMYLETNIYNNSLSANEALLMNALYDENNSLVSINTERVSLSNTDRGVRVKTELDVPSEATDKYSVYTYLWHDDGENEAYCDEIKAFEVLNSNSSFEITDDGSDLGLLNWSKIKSSAQAELTGDAHYGNVALYLKNGSGQSGIKQNISEILDMYGPGRYALNVETKSLSAGSKVILSYVSNGQTLKTESFISGESWNNSMLEFDVDNINESYVYIETSNGNGIYIDDAVITKLDY